MTDAKRAPALTVALVLCVLVIFFAHRSSLGPAALLANIPSPGDRADDNHDG